MNRTAPCLFIRKARQKKIEAPCASCGKKPDGEPVKIVQLSVFGCTKKGNCTMGTPHDGLFCCATCKIYQPGVIGPRFEELLHDGAHGHTVEPALTFSMPSGKRMP